MSAAKLPPGLDRLPSGKIRARYRDDTGRQHSKTFPDRGGIRAAQAWLRDQRSAVDAGVHVAPNSKVTVREYAAQWAAARPHRASSKRQVGTYLAHLDATPLGARPMRLVRPTEVQAWVSDRSASYAPQTVRNVYTFVKAVFAGAVEDGVIGRTPCTSKVVLPSVRRDEFVPLTVPQVRLIASHMDDRYRIGVTLQAALGLRISELLALGYDDFDLSARTVRVERQLGRNGKGFTVPKTHASIRTLPLAVSVAEQVREHWRTYQPNLDGTIITTTHGNAVRQDIYGQRFASAVAAARKDDPTLPAEVLPHALRHHFASVLLMDGIPANVVAKLLGHSTAKMVLEVYGHVMPGADDLTRKSLDALWSPNVSLLSHARAAKGA
jgi:integrase